MTKCTYCGSEVDFPFICHYCRQPFCVNHRLPEAHGCMNIISARPPRETIRIPKTYSHTPPFNIRSAARSEVGQIIITWLVLGFCFSIGSLYSPIRFMRAFLISLLTLGFGFLAHELAHRNIARRFGCWAEFRLWPLGLMMALIFALVSGGRFIFAAPGAVYIQPRSYIWSERITKREYGIISLSGPLMNIAVGAIFFFISLFGGILAEIGNIGFFVNFWLAAFNLIPFGMMDGYKVFRWSPKIWAIVALPIWLLLFLPGIL